MKVGILCGGAGVRMGEATQAVPKPLMTVGDRPILWHIMKLYEAAGFCDFVLLLGYRGEAIRAYFEQHAEPGWRVEYVDTGLETPTGGRLHRARDRFREGRFFLTYGDGLADVPLRDLLAHHERAGRAATMTVVRPHTQFGIVDIATDDVVTGFREKPRMNEWVNGGFFVMEPAVLDVVADDDVLEARPLETLAAKGELTAYRHDGFWQCMDTLKDLRTLNELHAKGAPWTVRK
ncbi:MAG TPA: sugar phosphate nucleotidyltransferase [Candidatus Thermoplasmatota archaeon]|nr:sugar phosphate nucleotidyltransferase [Candidatus Thermoplasmatota archaeon]